MFSHAPNSTDAARPGPGLGSDVALVRTLAAMAARDESKVERLHLRLSPADNGLIRQAADADHVSLSEFVIRAARSEAIRMLADRASVVITATEWEALEVRLREPGAVNSDLAKLFAKPSPFKR